MTRNLQQRVDLLATAHTAVQRAGVTSIFQELQKDEVFHSKAGRLAIEACLLHGSQVALTARTVSSLWCNDLPVVSCNSYTFAVGLQAVVSEAVSRLVLLFRRPGPC